MTLHVNTDVPTLLIFTYQCVFGNIILGDEELIHASPVSIQGSVDGELHARVLKCRSSRD